MSFVMYDEGGARGLEVRDTQPSPVLDTRVGEHRDKWAPATGLPSPVLAQSECKVLFCYHTPALWTPAAWQQVNVKSSLKM